MLQIIVCSSWDDGALANVPTRPLTSVCGYGVGNGLYKLTPLVLSRAPGLRSPFRKPQLTVVDHLYTVSYSEMAGSIAPSGDTAS